MDTAEQDGELEYSDFLLFYVNGKQIIERQVQPEWTLLWYLRNKLNLTGSKLGCGEGGCGACTVVVSSISDVDGQTVEYRSINACLAPLCSIDGCHVVTIEGIGSTKTSLHPIQKRVADFFGSQCGYCTPGIVMSLYYTICTNPGSPPTLADIEDSLDGNLCRCTGYRPILDAAKTFARDADKLLGAEKDYPHETNFVCSTTEDKLKEFCLSKEGKIPQIDFPQALRDYKARSIHIKGDLFEWYRPISLNELIKIRHLFPGRKSKLLVGNTEVLIETKFKNNIYPRFVVLTHIRELTELYLVNNEIIVGASVTITRLQKQLIEWLPSFQSRGQKDLAQAILDQLKYFGSTQVRNVASIGGNIINASPISDLNPVLQACGASLELHNFDRQIRYVSMRDFFLSYRRVNIQENDVLVRIHIPLPNPQSITFIHSYKQARRRDDDIAIVSGGFYVQLNENQTIEEAFFSFGGCGPITIMPNQAQKKLRCKEWTRATIDQFISEALAELPLLDEKTPGGQPEYRRALIQSFIFKFYLYINRELRKDTNKRFASAINSFEREISHGRQTFGKTSYKVVGQSLPHKSAYLQVSGEATYIDDMPTPRHGLYAALVLTTQPHARIKNIDITMASQTPGFIAFICHTDVPGSNKTGDIVLDEEVFVSSLVEYVGCLVGLVVAKTDAQAQRAAKLVKIEYEFIEPTVFTIDQAIQNGSYFEGERTITRGDIEAALHDAENTLEGELYIGGQEHFYLETNCCMALPNEDGELTLLSSTQSPSRVQELTALALGIDASKITCHVKRMGGGFGGKQTRSMTPCIAVAVAAVKLQRPVRLNIERDIDMCSTGQRHPFKGKYKVGFTSQGKFQALDVRLWSNAGYSHDLSYPVLERAVLHVENTYLFPALRVQGRLCKTNLPSNTAFRGFGGPQGMLVCETIVEHVASFLNKDPLTIRQLNVYAEGDTTHFKQELKPWHIPRMIDQLITTSDFKKRQKEVEQFNEIHAGRKRGISLLPTKFGIGFEAIFLNQAGALVHIYKDGSVLLSHGGTEMGQGLHTKMVAIASEILGCDVSRVRINETCTDKVINASSTAASLSSDLYGMAVRFACEKIRKRLDRVPRKDEMAWEDLIMQAYFQRLDLSAHGFYATPEPLGSDFHNNIAHFNYFTQGVAVSEVELDTLTGDWHLLRVDILMDLGSSLNPGIDIGQIECAFVQGLGLFTLEELIWGDNDQHKWVPPGNLFTRGPGTYKIPSFNDVPIDMRVSLLRDVPNSGTIYSSKAVGEPPFFLSASVFFALKQACMAYRREHGHSEYFRLDSPATVERLRMACTDEFTKRACQYSVSHEQFKARGSF